MRTLGKKIAPRVLYALTAAAGALSLLGIVLLAVAGGTITQLQGATAPLWLLEGLYALGLALLCCTAVLAGLRRSAVRPCPPGLRAVLWCAVAGAVVLLVNAPLAHLGRQLLRGDYLSVLATEMDPVSLGAGIALLRLYLIAQAVVGVWALGKLLGRGLAAPPPAGSRLGRWLSRASTAGGQRAVVLSGFGALLLGSLILCGALLGRTRVDLTDGLQPVFYGESGAGMAYVDQPPLPDTDDRRTADFWRGVGYEVTPSEGLHNGDPVQVRVVYDSAAARRARIQVSRASRTFSVQGLTERYRTPEDLPPAITDLSDRESRSLIKKNLRYLSAAGDFAYDRERELVKAQKVASYLMKSEPGGYNSDRYVALYQVTVRGQVKEESSYRTAQQDFYYYTELGGVDSDFVAGAAQVTGRYFSRRDEVHSLDQACAKVEAAFSTYTPVRATQNGQKT
ncbi:hypothetical protein H8K20_09545 [Neobittarella massiliensis]|uniref:Uncharacterized protein n=1 Tax=Neobittarella massiliensis (ex Bilen et al. 2018) TaxID=2041842 RepID=A0A8J6IGE0_9FIRM|nr:hypothetical protein [Neobittarella massiliensis]MBC3516635.1 hypothetical protein [Neobittarella massiliensis]